MIARETMKCLLKIFDAVLIRLIAFSFAFFFGLPFVSQISQEQNYRLLNVEIYKRPTNVDCTRPNPLILLVKIENTNHLTLNNEKFNLVELENKLSEVFRYRDAMDVKNEGETEINKTVFIKSDLSVSYEQLVEIIDSVNKAGANHIFIDSFNENCQPLATGCGFKLKESAIKHKRRNK